MADRPRHGEDEGTGDRQVHVRVWADVVCPWCWIGDRRLAEAVEGRSGIRLRRTWQPFQLDPDLPPEGLPWDEYLERKWGGPDRAKPFLEHVAGVARDVGLELRFDRVRRVPNTRRAHGLILAAREDGQGWAVAERLFSAHFQRGEDLTDPDLLRSAGEEVGLDPDLVDTAVGGDLDHRVVRSQSAARERGVFGVPFFLFEDGRHVSGAQPPEVFARLLETLPPEDDRRKPPRASP